MIYYLRMGATKEQAQNAIVELKVLQEQALDNGIEVTDEINARIDQMYASLEEQLGGEEVVVAQLQEIGLTKDQYTEIAKANYHAEAFLQQFPEKGIIKERQY